MGVPLPHEGTLAPRPRLRAGRSCSACGCGDDGGGGLAPPPISLRLPSTTKASPTDRVLRSASLLQATSGHFWPASDLD
jgi:hypothetical protein